MKCVYHLIKLKVKEAELRTKEKIENRLCFSRSFSEKVKNLTEKVVGWNWARKYLRALPPFFWGAYSEYSAYSAYFAYSAYSAYSTCSVSC